MGAFVEDKVYYVKTWENDEYLFKKAKGKYVTTCSKWYDLQRGTRYNGRVGKVTLTHNEGIVDLRHANINELDFWNRTFNENIEVV